MQSLTLSRYPAFDSRLRHILKPHCLDQGSPTWCPRVPGRPQGPSRSPAGLF